MTVSQVSLPDLTAPPPPPLPWLLALQQPDPRLAEPAATAELQPAPSETRWPRVFPGI